jgi:hypothetical protein
MYIPSLFKRLKVCCSKRLDSTNSFNHLTEFNVIESTMPAVLLFLVALCLVPFTPLAIILGILGFFVLFLNNWIVLWKFKTSHFSRI